MLKMIPNTRTYSKETRIIASGAPRLRIWSATVTGETRTGRHVASALLDSAGRASHRRDGPGGHAGRRKPTEVVRRAAGRAALARCTAGLAARRASVRRSTYRIDTIPWTASTPSRPVAGWNLQGLPACSWQGNRLLARCRAAQCVDRSIQVLFFFRNELNIEVGTSSKGPALLFFSLHLRKQWHKLETVPRILTIALFIISIPQKEQIL